MTEGLVQIRSNRGFFVRPIEIDDTSRFFDAYFVSERAAAYFCRFDDPGFGAEMDGLQRAHAAASWRRAVPGNFADERPLSYPHRPGYRQCLPRGIQATRLHMVAQRLAYFVYAGGIRRGLDLRRAAAPDT